MNGDSMIAMGQSQTPGPPKFVEKPRKFGELFETTFKIYKNLFKTAFLIAFIPNAIWLLHAFIPYARTCSSTGVCSLYSTTTVILILVTATAIIILGIWATGAITVLASNYLFGKKLGVRDSYSQVSSSLLSLLWGGIVVAFRVAIGTLLLIIPGILATLNNYLYPQCIILEKSGGSDGARRSRELISHKNPNFGHPRWYVLGILAVAFGLVFGTGILVNIPAMAIAMLTAQEFSIEGLREAMGNPQVQITYSILRALVNSLVFPVIPIFMTLLYYDLKNKKEGSTTPRELKIEPQTILGW